MQDCETAFVEFYVSEKCAFTFIKCWKQDCPRAIEYTPSQIRKIIVAAQAVKLSEAVEVEQTLMASLEAVSVALKIDTVLAAVPPSVKRLILVPHGPLMAVPLHMLPLGKLADRIASDRTDTDSRSSNLEVPLLSESAAHLKQGLDRDQELLMDRFPFGVLYTSSINIFMWAQQEPIDARFAPMLQCLTVGRPRGGKNVPRKDAFDMETRSTSTCNLLPVYQIRLLEIYRIRRVQLAPSISICRALIPCRGNLSERCLCSPSDIGRTSQVLSAYF